MMTDKEQIMIDDVDVKNCNFFLSSNKYCGLYSTGCRFVPDCDYKQLARKMQECEELKEENQQLRMQFCNDCGEKDDYNIPCKMIRDLDYGLQKEIEENDRYRKALEKIEEIVKNPCNLYEPTSQCIKCVEGEILDIISKVKGEEF